MLRLRKQYSTAERKSGKSFLFIYWISNLDTVLNQWCVSPFCIVSTSTKIWISKANYFFLPILGGPGVPLAFSVTFQGSLIYPTESLGCLHVMVWISTSGKRLASLRQTPAIDSPSQKHCWYFLDSLTQGMNGQGHSNSLFYEFAFEWRIICPKRSSKEPVF